MTRSISLLSTGYFLLLLQLYPKTDHSPTPVNYVDQPFNVKLESPSHQYSTFFVLVTGTNGKSQHHTPLTYINPISFEQVIQDPILSISLRSRISGPWSNSRSVKRVISKWRWSKIWLRMGRLTKLLKVCISITRWNIDIHHSLGASGFIHASSILSFSTVRRNRRPMSTAHYPSCAQQLLNLQSLGLS